MLDPVPTLDQRDCPSVVESEVSSIASIPNEAVLVVREKQVGVEAATKREPLQWEFKGLTLWLEFEEFDMDLSRTNEFLSKKFGTELIPLLHCTAIYGMEHLSAKDAIARMAKIKKVLPDGEWPVMDPPIAIKQDISQEGRPGQVCSISWAELTLRTSNHHEQAMNALCELFEVTRTGPWTPHISLAYDNPENSVLNLADIVSHVMFMPTLLRKKRRVKAISLWNTKGKMKEWICLERINWSIDCSKEKSY